MTTKRVVFLLTFLCLLASSLFSQRVYITRTGAKYHAEYCRYLSKSKIAISLDDALSRDYSPCSVCSPVLRSRNVANTGVSANASLTGNDDDSKQCIAITKKGSRCKRTAASGSLYCWQHQKKEVTGKSYSSDSGERTIYTGPRGGHYYYNSKGHKVYIKRK